MIVTLTSDLGTTDYYVATIKGALLSNIKPVQIIDITHQIPAFDIVKASQILQQAYNYYPPDTVHCLLVNHQSLPEAPVCVAKYKGQYFIGPDNGFFSFLFEDEQADEMVRMDSLSDSNYTFPFFTTYLQVIQGLQQKKALHEFGQPVSSMVEKLQLRPYLQQHILHGYIWHIDHFGNLITNISRQVFDRACKGRKFMVEVGRYQQQQISRHYDNRPEAAMVIFFNYAGFLEIAVRNGNASSLMGVDRNDKVMIHFSE